MKTICTVVLMAANILICSSQVPTNGLVAYYPFNGNANDESGNSNNGSIYGVTSTTDRFGNQNSAYLFDGDNDYIEINHSSSLNITQSITISYWVKMETSGPYYFPYHIIEKHGCWGSGQRDNDINWGVMTDNGDFFTWALSFDFNQWYNLTMKYDGLNVSIYVNGQLYDSEPASGSIKTNTNKVYISRYDQGGNYYFDGTLDDFRIYNRALSESEIQQLYNESNTNGNSTNETRTLTDDRDGHTYKTVKIGNQWWMAENLAYLPAVSPSSSLSNSSPYYYVFNYEGTNISSAKATSNYQTYGVLYNWPAAMAGEASSNSNPSGVQGVCPDGWHLPSVAEWEELIEYLGGEAIAGGKLKEIGNAWDSPNGGATNESGFSALPGGMLSGGGFFFPLTGRNGMWWSATYDEEINANAHSYYMYHTGPSIHQASDYPTAGLNVRCVQNEGTNNTKDALISNLTNGPTNETIEVPENGRGYKYYYISSQEASLFEAGFFSMKLLRESTQEVATTAMFLKEGVLRIDVPNSSLSSQETTAFTLPDVIQIGGTNYTISNGPITFYADRIPMTYTRTWDIFGGGSAGASAILGGVGAGISVAAAKLSVKGSGGIGLKMQMDENGRIIFDRRFELGVSTKLQIPSVNIGVKAEDLADIKLGISGSLGSKAIWGQGFCFNDIVIDAETIVKAQAGYLLETFSIGGLELSPIVGPLIRAAKMDLSNTIIFETTKLNDYFGFGSEGELSAGLSFKLNETIEFTAIEAATGWALQTTNITQYRDINKNLYINPIYGKTIEQTVTADLSAFQWKITFNDNIKLTSNNSSLFDVGTSSEVKYFSLGNSYSFIGLSATVKGGGDIRIGLFDKETYFNSKFDFPKEYFSLIKNSNTGLSSMLGGNKKIPLGNKGMINDLVTNLNNIYSNFNGNPIGLTTEEVREQGFNIDIGVDLDAALGVGLGIKFGVKLGFLDEISFPRKYSTLYANGENYLLYSSEYNNIMGEYDIKNVLKEIIIGAALFLKDRIIEFLETTEEIVDAGKKFALNVQNKANEVIGFLNGKLTQAGILKSTAYSPESPRIIQSKAFETL